MRLVGKPIPKISRLMEKRRKLCTWAVMREYEIIVVLASISFSVIAPETIIFACAIIVVTMLANILLKKFRPLCAKLVYFSLLYLRVVAATVLFGYRSHSHNLLFDHFLTAVIFFPESPRIMELESMLMVMTFIAITTFSPTDGLTRLENARTCQGMCRMLTMIQLSIDVVVYFMLYSDREIKWMGKIARVLEMCREKQESFVGRLCHVSRTCLNSIVPPLEEYVLKFDDSSGHSSTSTAATPSTRGRKKIKKEEVKEVQILLFHASIIHHTILRLVDSHEFQSHYISGSEIPYLVKSYDLETFFNKMDVSHRQIFGIHEKAKNIALTNNLYQINKNKFENVVIRIDRKRFFRVSSSLIFFALTKKSFGTICRDISVIVIPPEEEEEEEELMYMLALSVTFRTIKPLKLLPDRFSDLSITEQNVRFMNGKMKVTNKMEDQKTTIEVTLPVIYFNHMKLSPKKEEEEKEYYKPKMKVLIVEDNFVNRKVLEHCCRNKLSCDSEIVTAVDGFDGLQKFNLMKLSSKALMDRSRPCVDCCFIDYNMPNMNGLNLAKNLRKLIEREDGEEEKMNEFLDDNNSKRMKSKRRKPKMFLVTAMLMEENFSGNNVFDGILSKPVKEKKIEKILLEIDKEQRRNQLGMDRETGRDGLTGRPVGWEGKGGTFSCLEEPKSLITEQSIFDFKFSSDDDHSFMKQLETWLPILLHLIFVVPMSKTISSWFYPVMILVSELSKLMFRFIFPEEDNEEFQTQESRTIRKSESAVVLLLYTNFLLSFLLGGGLFHFRYKLYTLAPMLIVINIPRSQMSKTSRKTFYFQIIFQVIFICFVFFVLEISCYSGIVTKYYYFEQNNNNNNLPTLLRFAERFNVVHGVLVIFTFIQLVGTMMVKKFKNERKKYKSSITNLEKIKEEQEFVISKISNDLASPLKKLEEVIDRIEEKFQGLELTQFRFYETSTPRKRRRKKKVNSFQFLKNSIGELSLLNMNFKMLYCISSDSYFSRKEELLLQERRIDLPSPPPPEMKKIEITKVVRKIVERSKKIIMGMKKTVFLFMGSHIDTDGYQQSEITITTTNNNKYFCDKSFELIVSNVIDNSVKNTEVGSIKIDLAYLTSEKMLEIQIVDTGCGIRKKKMDEIIVNMNSGFEATDEEDIDEILMNDTTYESMMILGKNLEHKPCMRRRSSLLLREISSPTLGIGLMVCSRIIKMMKGGEFIISSDGKGKGTKTTFRVPCEIVV